MLLMRNDVTQSYRVEHEITLKALLNQGLDLDSVFIGLSYLQSRAMFGPM